MADLKKGEKVPLDGGSYAEVLRELGSGGQGTVYLVKMDGKEYALKWYRPSKLANPEVHRRNLEQNIFDGPPSKRFLWPKKLTLPYKGTFGYLMDVRPKEYSDFASILNAKVRFNSLHSIVIAALNIVDSFRSLHRQGKCYQDLNDGSFFINTQNGEVLICDNDNVTPDKQNIGMAGMPGYMAPEIVRGEARPETQTDYHSLAVILFKLFIRHDPFMGKAFVSSVCITEEAEKKLYGDKPVFIFDQKDESNKPVPHVHSNPIKLWPLYPNYLKTGFVWTFGEGINHPEKRLADEEWRKLIIRLRGEILTCQCGQEFFAFSVEKRAKDGKFKCPGCGTVCSFPMRLNLKDKPVYLFPDNKIYKCHAVAGSDDYSTEVGKVVRNKRNPSVWGIKNLSNRAWFTTNGSSRQVIQPGSVAILSDGLMIDFDQVTGKVEK